MIEKMTLFSIGFHDAMTTKEKIAKTLCDAVVVVDGNTEINEVYYEVKFLRETIWSCGGSAAVVIPAAERRAEKFRKLLRKIVEKA